MGKQCGNWSKIATVENPTRFAANMTARPHGWLGGRTPDEVYFGNFPANRRQI